MHITLTTPPRVALFPDTYDEPNGVATLSRHMALFAERQQFPLLVVRGGGRTASTREGSVEMLELKRGAAAFRLDKGLYFDPFLTRHMETVMRRLVEFKPDLIHISGPGDIGFLGLLVSHKMRIPLVASWHTNLHEYLARRLDKGLRLVPASVRRSICRFTELQSLRGFLRFYRTARFTLAPNWAFVEMLQASTGRPSYLMRHGVDLDGYMPAPLTADGERPFCIGYVGRLTAEKSVQELAEVESRLIAAGETNYKFLLVGDGGRQNWLQRNLQRVEFRGVLRGEALAAAYREMDAFVFPSRTDTFGLVVLEAMASGVPVVLTPESGSRVGVEDGKSGLLTNDFSSALLKLMRDFSLRRSMSYQARKLAAEHSWDGVFEQLYSTYAEGLAIEDSRREERERALPRMSR